MIECFCVPTANGQKATILLEELELDYEITRVDLRKGEHLSPEYLAMNPVGRAPTIIDRAGPKGEPLTVYGTLAIAVYLCEKGRPAAAGGRGSEGSRVPVDELYRL